MTDAEYVFTVGDTSSGTLLAELPLAVSSPIQRMINGAGQWSASLSADDPGADDSILGVGVSSNRDREITAWRNGVPVWNGPIVNLAGNLRSRTVTLTMAEPWLFFTQRVLEWDSSNLWSAVSAVDLFDIIRALFIYATTKDSTGTTSGGTSINAAIPRFAVSPAAGTLAGVTKSLSYAGTDRRVIADIITDLVKDPTTGLDFRCDYSLVSGALQRTLTLGSPSLGAGLVGGTITGDDLYDFDKVEDLTRSVTRAHATGTGYVDTEQNTGSVAAGDILREGVFQVPDSSYTITQIQQFAKDARRRSQPPVTSYALTYIPTVGGIDFGTYNLGDKANLGISGPSILHSEGHVRVAQIGFLPPSAASEELVTLTAEISLDSLGT